MNQEGCEVDMCLTDQILITFKFGGQWVTVKNQARKRYDGGRQKSIRCDRCEVDFLMLRLNVEEICSLDSRHAYDIYWHIPGTSPKEYKLLQRDVYEEAFMLQVWRCARFEILVVAPNSLEEDMDVQSFVQFTPPSVPEESQCISVNVVDDEKLLIKARCRDAQAFKQALRTESIVTNFGIRIVASNKLRVLASCSHSGCPWRIRAALFSDGLSFEVRKLVSIHTCPGVNRAGNSQATTDWIAEEIKDLVKQKPSVPPKEIKSKMKSSFGLSLSYMKLWRSKELAHENIYGSVDENYKYVPTFNSWRYRANGDRRVYARFSSLTIVRNLDPVIGTFSNSCITIAHTRAHIFSFYIRQKTMVTIFTSSQSDACLSLTCGKGPGYKSRISLSTNQISCLLAFASTLRNA